jgi:hypothetical protein
MHAVSPPPNIPQLLDIRIHERPGARVLVAHDPPAARAGGAD